MDTAPGLASVSVAQHRESLPHEGTQAYDNNCIAPSGKELSLLMSERGRDWELYELYLTERNKHDE